MWSNLPRSAFGGLRAVRAGTGPLVLLLHGVGLRAEAWTAQIDGLAARYNVVAPDMPGHGESSRLSSPPTLAAYTDAVAGALDGPVLIAGHSMGAMIALDLAVRWPERVRGIAALNAIYRRTPEAEQAVHARAAALRSDRSADPTQTLARWFGDHGSDAALACKGWLTEVDPAGYRDAYSVFAAADGPSDAGLMALGCPALFATGAQEPNSTPAMSETMARLAPKGQSRVLSGAAHMMPMTHASVVSDMLETFFEGCLA